MLHLLFDRIRDFYATFAIDIVQQTMRYLPEKIESIVGIKEVRFLSASLDKLIAKCQIKKCFALDNI